VGIFPIGGGPGGVGGSSPWSNLKTRPHLPLTLQTEDDNGPHTFSDHHRPVQVHLPRALLERGAHLPLHCTRTSLKRITSLPAPDRRSVAALSRAAPRDRPPRQSLPRMARSGVHRLRFGKHAVFKNEMLEETTEMLDDRFGRRERPIEDIGLRHPPNAFFTKFRGRNAHPQHRIVEGIFSGWCACPNPIPGGSSPRCRDHGRRDRSPPRGSPSSPALPPSPLRGRSGALRVARAVGR
jgi:hypothetical protein